MQLPLDIICPYHLAQEVLTLPESYSANFSGEVPCGDEPRGMGRATLYIALTGGEVKELGLVEIPRTPMSFSELLASSDPSRPAPAGARQRGRRPTAPKRR